MKFVNATPGCYFPLIVTKTLITNRYLKMVNVMILVFCISLMKLGQGTLITRWSEAFWMTYLAIIYLSFLKNYSQQQTQNLKLLLCCFFLIEGHLDQCSGKKLVRTIVNATPGSYSPFIVVKMLLTQMQNFKKACEIWDFWFLLWLISAKLLYEWP